LLFKPCVYEFLVDKPEGRPIQIFDEKLKRKGNKEREEEWKI
jgi:hypothetical protein